ncbi:MAG: SagB/ThcOx family dehydrogenase [Patescibacteria group bacterium]
MDSNPPDFSKIFHQSSKDSSKGHLPISRDANEWPDEWKTTYYKAYSRLPKIALPDNPPQANFFHLIKARKSRRDFSRIPIDMRELSLLLKYSCGDIGEMGVDRHRRAQPSAGSRFPIEIYPIVFRPQKELAAGLYHYNVKEHALDVLWGREWSDDEIGSLFTYPWVKDAALALVMTAVFWRNANKYGERGYRYILLEAGHIGQNVYLASEALGLKCCAFGGTRDAALEKLIDIDGINESVIYALAIGK